jgi:hypothetical protein
MLHLTNIMFSEHKGNYTQLRTSITSSTDNVGSCNSYGKQAARLTLDMLLHKLLFREILMNQP